MMYRILLLAVLFLVSIPKVKAAEPETKLNQALSLLSSTKIGAQELNQAKELHIPIVAGNVSRTDVTATRSYHDGGETTTYQTQVLISQDKEIVFQALDLAHELVHATRAKNNPFDPSLNLATYVKHGIEGEGGEAQAIAAECEAGQEMIDQNTKNNLLRADTIQVIKARCQFVWKTVAQDSKWKQSFYYLGEHYREFLSQVSGLNLAEQEKADWKDKVESKSPMFASAVAHKPYPLALLEEYLDITKRICSKAKAQGINRAVASIDLLKERCQAIGASFAP